MGLPWGLHPSLIAPYLTEPMNISAIVWNPCMVRSMLKCSLVAKLWAWKPSLWTPPPDRSPPAQHSVPSPSPHPTQPRWVWFLSSLSDARTPSPTSLQTIKIQPIWLCYIFIFLNQFYSDFKILFIFSFCQHPVFLPNYNAFFTYWQPKS